MTHRFEDPAAEFVLAVERVFGEHPRELEAGERELWLIETHGPLEHRLAMVQVWDDVEDALREAKEKLSGLA